MCDITTLLAGVLLAALFYCLVRRTIRPGHRCVVFLATKFDLQLAPGLSDDDARRWLERALEVGFVQSGLTDVLFDDTPFLDGQVPYGEFLEEGAAVFDGLAGDSYFQTSRHTDKELGQVAQIALVTPTRTPDTHNARVIMEIYLDPEGK